MFKNLEGKKMSIMVNRYDIILFFNLFFALRIDSIGYIFPLSELYYYVSFLILFFVMVFFLLSNSKKSPVICLTITLFMLYFFSTVIKSPDNAYRAVVNFTAPLSIALLAEIHMQKRAIHFLKVMNVLFILLMLVDVGTIFVFPQGMYRSSLYTLNWFLGYKSSRVRAVTLPAIAIAGILDIYRYGKLKLKFMLVSILAIVDTYLSTATAGTIACLFEFIAIFALFFSMSDKIRRFIRRLFDTRVLLLVIIGLNLFLVIFQTYQNNTFIEYIVVDLLDKSMAFSGRDRIWLVSLQQFMNAKFIGNGYISGERYIMLTGTRGGTQPHNLILALLVYTGGLGLIIYSILLILTLKKADGEPHSLSVICVVYIFANLLFGITSMNMFGQFHYAMMVILYYLSIHERSFFEE